ncbi:hypothetical protein PR048_019109 [Dryococelus australis]|uniref:Uncharacterized protein n=1 Tax=Dryococelus australis TaxID=614101 RepID=A0ABQ9H2L5_9NEOP|nr:hypothetical protein PR048_019109 [Dryococelus australis]
MRVTSLSVGAALGCLAGFYHLWGGGGVCVMSDIKVKMVLTAVSVGLGVRWLALVQVNLSRLCKWCHHLPPDKAGPASKSSRLCIHRSAVHLAKGSGRWAEPKRSVLGRRGEEGKKVHNLGCVLNHSTCFVQLGWFTISIGYRLFTEKFLLDDLFPFCPSTTPLPLPTPAGRCAFFSPSTGASPAFSPQRQEGRGPERCTHQPPRKSWQAETIGAKEQSVKEPRETHMSAHNNNQPLISSAKPRINRIASLVKNILSFRLLVCDKEAKLSAAGENNAKVHAERQEYCVLVEILALCGDDAVVRGSLIHIASVLLCLKRYMIPVYSPFVNGMVVDSQLTKVCRTEFPVHPGMLGVTVAKVGGVRVRLILHKSVTSRSTGAGSEGYIVPPETL